MGKEENFWRKYINSLPIEDFEESTTAEMDITKKDAAVLRLKLDLYLLSPLDEGSKAYMVTGNQRLEDLGVMSIEEALALIKKRNGRNS